MIDRRAKPGAPSPLLDRLINVAPDEEVEVRPARVLGKEELRRSVAFEVARLLNTRAPRSIEETEAGGRTTLDYGMPDYSAYSGVSGLDTNKICRLVEVTIEAYEPRLRSVRVAVEGYDRTEADLQLAVSADLVCGDIREAFYFPVSISRPEAPGLRDGR